MDQIYQTKDSLELQAAAQSLTDKLEIIGMNLIQIKKWQKTAISQLFDLESKSKNFIKLDFFRSEHEIFEKRIRDFVTEQIGTLQENLNQHKVELKETEKQFEESLNTNQKETLWKIRDCEELLKTRISDHKVECIIENLEQKLNKQVKLCEAKQTDATNVCHNELQNQIDALHLFTQDKHKDLKSVVQEQIDLMASKVDQIKFNELEHKVIYNREIVDDENEMMQKYLREMKDKMGEHNKKFNDVIQQLEDNTQGINKNKSLIHKNKSMIQQLHSQGDHMHHDCNEGGHLQKHDSQESGLALRSQHTGGGERAKKLTLSSKHNVEPPSGLLASPEKGAGANISRKVKAELIDNKLLEFEDNISQIEDTLNQLFEDVDLIKPCIRDVRALQSEKISKEEIKDYLPSEAAQIQQIKMICREEMEPVNLNLRKQLESWDRKMVQMRKELNIAEIHAMIDKKADLTDMYQRYDEHQNQITATNNSFNMFTEDFTACLVEFNHMKKRLEKLQIMNNDVLIGKRNTNCISCSKA